MRIFLIDARFYATDQYSVYNIIPRHKRLVGKEHTYTVERMNRLLRHYLAVLLAKLIVGLKVLT